MQWRTLNSGSCPSWLLLAAWSGWVGYFSRGYQFKTEKKVTQNDVQSEEYPISMRRAYQMTRERYYAGVSSV